MAADEGVEEEGAGAVGAAEDEGCGGEVAGGGVHCGDGGGERGGEGEEAEEDEVGVELAAGGARGSGAGEEAEEGGEGDLRCVVLVLEGSEERWEVMFLDFGGGTGLERGRRE